MNMVKIPGVFHELFGSRTTKLELGLTLLFSAGMTILLLAFTFPELIGLAVWKRVLIAILTIDITGGVVANFSYSTNLHYRQSPRARIGFILSHVQPLVLVVLWGGSYATGLAIWGYTVVSALLVNHLIDHPCQRLIAAVLASFGISALALAGVESRLLLVLLILYTLKVIYAFSVDHFASRKK